MLEACTMHGQRVYPKTITHEYTTITINTRSYIHRTRMYMYVNPYVQYTYNIFHSLIYPKLAPDLYRT